MWVGQSSIRIIIPADRKCNYTTGETTTIWSWGLVFYFPDQIQIKEMYHGPISLVVGGL